ncbi:Uncharacterised protein [Starkeya nomas]|uniref:DUF3486 family protein n=1 Tax=Starkeya nomas TaxID=2666134 RepID=A0A5S9R7H4_9HYPH|nr:phage protein Gp27 family protein [Starkeya nomas]CAA0130470.1 Uncharacterised protein [Starkeya nomas]
MARLSKVDRLPAELRDLIGRLREGGHTIDEILGKLKELDADIGRSGLGEHLKKFDAMRERLHRSRAAAESIMSKLEEAGTDDRVARFNISSLHASVMELMATADGEGGLDPKSAKLLSETMRNLATAAKGDQDRIINLKKHLAAEAVKAAETAVGKATAAGGPVDPVALLEQIRQGIYGMYDE